MKRVTTAVLILFAAGSLRAATYYVKPDGNDEATGRTSGRAWKTVARVNAQAFESGDKLLFERGGVWRETLTLRAEGLIVGAYGDGALPVISGADPVSGLTPGESSNVWKATFATNPVQLFVNGVRGQRMPTAAEVTGDRRWYWDRATEMISV